MTQNKLSKLQIRAEILNTLKLILANQKITDIVKDSIENLKNIDNKQAILDILIKEITLAKDEKRITAITYLLSVLIPKDLIDSRLWDLLSSISNDDNAKLNIINALNTLGNKINYEKYVECLDNPEDIINADTSKMLKTALVNPEAQIDFLDFIEALQSDDKTMLISSLAEDYTGDELVNIFIPIIYAKPDSELCKYSIKRLGELRSSFAIKPLNWLLENSTNDEIKTLATKNLKLLKLAGITQDSTDNFYKKLFENTQIQNAYVSLPDGHSNIGIIVVRKNNETNTSQMFATVVNDTIGIVDCFGFNDLGKSELINITGKFYTNQTPIIAPIEFVKKLLLQAEKLSLEKYRTVPYEYICWKSILGDIKEFECDITNFIGNALKITDITANDVKYIYENTQINKWFFNFKDNPVFDALIQDIKTNLNESIFDKDTFFIDLQSKINETFSKIWTSDFVNQLNNRLLLTAYFYKLQKQNKEAGIFYSLIFKNKIKELLQSNIINLSIYEYLLSERDKHSNTKVMANIFQKRTLENVDLIDINHLDLVIKKIEEVWCH